MVPDAPDAQGNHMDVIHTFLAAFSTMVGYIGWGLAAAIAAQSPAAAAQLERDPNGRAAEDGRAEGGRARSSRFRPRVCLGSVPCRRSMHSADTQRLL